MNLPKTLSRTIAIALVIGATIASPARQAHAKSGLASYNAYHRSGVTASKEYACGDKILVVNPKNRKRMVVTVVDYGPFVGGRVLDLDENTFSYLFGGLSQGVGRVLYRRIYKGSGYCQHAHRRINHPPK